MGVLRLSEMSDAEKRTRLAHWASYVFFGLAIGAFLIGQLPAAFVIASIAIPLRLWDKNWP